MKSTPIASSTASDPDGNYWCIPSTKERKRKCENLREKYGWRKWKVTMWVWKYGKRVRRWKVWASEKKQNMEENEQKTKKDVPFGVVV